jgi:predicted DNA-binding transcriptional regulator AlpA
MRCDKAASYLDMSQASFLRLVESGDFPAGVPIRGMMVWDRYELDACFENFKDKRQRKRNTVNEALGIEDDQED